MDQMPNPANPENEKNALKVNLTGASGALPIWADFMHRALANEPVLQFGQNPGVTTISIDRHTGKFAIPGCPKEQVLQEKYLKDHSPKDASCEKNWPPTVNKTEE